MNATSRQARPVGPAMFWGFIVLMVALTGLFIGLGKWQLDRMAQQDARVAAIAARMHQPPVTLPPPAKWATLNPDAFRFRQITLKGHLLNDQMIRVYTALDVAKGRYSGVGYWIMTPFALDGGGTVFVNRGFVPKPALAAFDEEAPPQGEITLTGIAQQSVAAGAFTPAPDRKNRIEWVRDTRRLAAMDGSDLASPVLDMYIDLPAGPAGALPQGGETTLNFPDRHLGYAWTWFGFAIITPIMLLYWIAHQRRRVNDTPPSA